MAFRESKSEEPCALTASLALSLQLLTRVILCLTFPLLTGVVGKPRLGVSVGMATHCPDL